MDDAGAATATASTASAELKRLADELTERCLRFDPFRGTLFGLPEYDGLMPDASPAAEDGFRSDLETIRAQAAALEI